MRRGLAREARRRPDQDLLVGPLEAAEPPVSPDRGTGTASPDPSGIEIPDDPEELPTWREDW